MPRIRDEHHQLGGGGLPAPSRNGSGPTVNVAADGVPPGPTKPSIGIRLVRYGLPGAIILAGIVILAVVPGTAGVEGVVTMFGVCMCVVLFNGLVRLGVSGDKDRDTEQAARDEFQRTGVWPDEPRRTP